MLLDLVQMETESQLRNDLSKAVELFKELTSQTRKVILFQCVSSPMLSMHQESQNSFRGRKSGIGTKMGSANFGALECTIGIQYEVAMEITKGEPKYFKIDETGKMVGEISLYRGAQHITYRVMEWSEEREAFFKNIYSGMESMFLKMAQFFSDDDKQVLQLIDASGGKLLLGN